MKKHFYICASLFISLAAALHAEAPFFKVNGSVKSYTQTTYLITQKFGDYYRTPDTSYVHTIGSNGLETDVSQVNAAGTIISRITYAYDDAGNKISQTCTDGAGTIEWKQTFTYENGLLKEESEFKKDDTLSSKSIFKYSADNKQTDESYYNGEGALIWKSISKFDDNNRKLETLQYTADGQLDQRQVFTYNDAGNLVQIDTFNNVDEQTEKVIYRYGDNNLVGETASTNIANGTQTREFYKYDDAGNLTKVTTYSVSTKFGSTMNELVDMSEYTYTK